MRRGCPGPSGMPLYFSQVFAQFFEAVLIEFLSGGQVVGHPGEVSQECDQGIFGFLLVGQVKMDGVVAGFDLGAKLVDLLQVPADQVILKVAPNLMLVSLIFVTPGFPQKSFFRENDPVVDTGSHYCGHVKYTGVGMGSSPRTSAPLPFRTIPARVMVMKIIPMETVTTYSGTGISPLLTLYCVAKRFLINKHFFVCQTILADCANRIQKRY